MSGTPDIVMAGNLTADPELRFTPSGQAVANFTVACTERILDKQTNEWRDGDTTFIRCSVWRQLAENVAETLTKGMRVIVTGRLKVRQYETREGGKGTSVECDVTEVGPSLKNASAKVMRTTRENQGQGGQRRQQQDPWSAGGQDPWSAGGQDPWGPPQQPQQQPQQLWSQERQQQWTQQQQQQPQGPPPQQPQGPPPQQQLPSQQGHSQQQAWGNTPAANSPWGNQPPTPDEAPF